jgi:hypothetical protein
VKKKIKLTCILKSGVIVKDAIWVNSKDEHAMMAIYQMKTAVEDSVGHKEPKLQNVTFGHTTISVSEIAAITIK